MRIALRLGVAAFVVVLLSASASTSLATPTASGPCTKATARQLIAEHNLNGFRLPDPVLQLLCGPFTGPAGQAMAIVIGPLPTCWPSQEWVVFSLTGGEWKLVLDRTQFIEPPLVAVGGDIRETAPIFRPGDARCIPTGGSHARLWHWNGTRFVAGPWKQVKPPKPIGIAQLYSPSRNIRCGMLDSARYGAPNVVCWSLKPERRVSMNVKGKLNICRTGCTADFGETPRPQLLAYGKQITVGRFRCYSLRTGMKCIVIRSGKGFLINRDGVRKVG